MKRGASVPPHRASLTALGAALALVGEAHESSAGPATLEDTSHFLVGAVSMFRTSPGCQKRELSSKIGFPHQKLPWSPAPLVVSFSKGQVTSAVSA